MCEHVQNRYCCLLPYCATHFNTLRPVLSSHNPIVDTHGKNKNTS